MENILSYMYSFIPIISIVGYVPQIKLLWRGTQKAKSVSLSSWSLWLTMSAVSLGYGALCLQDFLFSMTCAMNLLGCLTIVMLILYKRSNRTLFSFVRT